LKGADDFMAKNSCNEEYTGYRTYIVSSDTSRSRRFAQHITSHFGSKNSVVELSWVKDVDWETEDAKIIIVDMKDATDGKWREIKKKIRLTDQKNVQFLLLITATQLSQHHEIFHQDGVIFLQLPVSNLALATTLKILKRDRSILLSDPGTGRRDRLSGLLFRQEFIERVKPVYASAVRNQVGLCCGIMSVGRMDSVNRRFGQRAGDRVLVEFSDLLKARKRDTDFFGRFGSNKFIFMAVNMRPTHLDTYLDDLILSCMSHSFRAGHVSLNVPLNIGATTYLGRNLNDMLLQAEDALSRSRMRGDNQFTIVNEICVDPVPMNSAMM
jgi:diguanylate cyclase (GGDEF)-like protein